MPFGDGTGPLGNGPFGFGRGFCRGYGRKFGRGFGYYRNPYFYSIPQQIQNDEYSDSFLLAELKRIESEILLLQQEQARIEKIINDKKSIPAAK